MLTKFWSIAAPKVVIITIMSLEHRSWHLKSTGLFVEKLIEVKSKSTSGFPSQRASNAESISMFWHQNFDNNAASDRQHGPRFNMKMTSYQHRKYHCGDKTILRPSYLHNGISYTGKTTSLYWIGAMMTFLFQYICIYLGFGIHCQVIWITSLNWSFFFWATIAARQPCWCILHLSHLCRMFITWYDCSDLGNLLFLAWTFASLKIIVLIL